MKVILFSVSLVITGLVVAADPFESTYQPRDHETTLIKGASVFDGAGRHARPSRKRISRWTDAGERGRAGCGHLDCRLRRPPAEYSAALDGGSGSGDCLVLFLRLQRAPTFTYESA